jgi:hypothetical protein
MIKFTSELFIDLAIHERSSYKFRRENKFLSIFLKFKIQDEGVLVFFWSKTEGVLFLHISENVSVASTVLCSYLG